MTTVTQKKKRETKEKSAEANSETSLTASVFDSKGAVSKKIELDPSIFGLPWNSDLVHQVVVSLESSSRKGTAHTKSRGEVRGGGIKPWRQKGTGRARHGSIRSPIWVGGGVAHGPRNEKNYARKVNRAMAAKALATVLSRKYKEGEIVLAEEISINKPSTKEAVSVIAAWKKIPALSGKLSRSKNAALVIAGDKNANVFKSFRNIGNAAIEEARNLNILALLKYKILVISGPEKSLGVLYQRFGAGSIKKDAPVSPENKKRKDK